MSQQSVCAVCILFYLCTYRLHLYFSIFFFFFNDTATTEIYTLSLHDVLPISPRAARGARRRVPRGGDGRRSDAPPRDRKSTRLNSSHPSISYAVFCLKKKKKHNILHCVHPG